MYAKNIIKIHLLFISLEALNLYSLDNYKKNNYIQFLQNFIQTKRFIITPFNYIFKKINYDKINHFNEILILIYILYIISNNYYINNLIENIIFYKTKNNNYYLLNQYINKFTYIYNKTYNYYYSNASNKKYDIKEIAITNLYVIKKVISQKNISYLINYLFI